MIEQVQDQIKQAANFILIYWYVLALGVWGGIVSLISKATTKKLTISFVILDFITFSFVATLVFIICLSLKTDVYIMAVATAISGHLGGRLMPSIEALFLAKIGGKK